MYEISRPFLAFLAAAFARFAVYVLHRKGRQVLAKITKKILQLFLSPFGRFRLIFQVISAQRALLFCQIN